MGDRIAIIAKHLEEISPLCASLRAAKYDVIVLEPSNEIREDLHTCSPKLVIYDCDNPDGLYNILHEIRDAHDVPVMIIAPGYTDTFIASVLRSGADDCIAKPYALAELLARIEAHLRRCWTWGARPAVN